MRRAWRSAFPLPRRLLGWPVVANQPRANNPHRSVRVEDDLWEAAKVAAALEGTTRAEVMQQALRDLVDRNRGKPFAASWEPRERARAFLDSLPEVEGAADEVVSRANREAWEDLQREWRQD